MNHGTVGYSDTLIGGSSLDPGSQQGHLKGSDKVVVLSKFLVWNSPMVSQSISITIGIIF